jgi:hypothetical protein
MCTELIVMGSNYKRSYDPATGKELWRCSFEASVPVGKGGNGSGRIGFGTCKSIPVADKEMFYLGM